MRFKYIKLREANDEKLITFSERNNHVFSIANSKGKTTLLRLLLYSIGYNIPGTKNFNFDKCYVECQVEIATREEVTLIRETQSYIVVKCNGEVTTYPLPGQVLELHSMLLGIKNLNLLRNILGVFYFDQEKGWVLLHKGVVVGNNKYNVGNLIMGINDIDCSALIEQRKQLSQELTKYKQMLSVSKYKETLEKGIPSLPSEIFDKEAESELTQIRMRISFLKKELARIDKVQKENENFKRFIEEMAIMVRMSDGHEELLNSNNIVGYNDTIDYLNAKRKMVVAEYNQVVRELKTFTNNQQKESRQLAMFEDVGTITQIFDERVSDIPIDSSMVESMINTTQKEIKTNVERTNQLIRTGSEDTLRSIYSNTEKYLNELGLDGEGIIRKYITKNSSRGLSGAILHMTVFAFRMACLIEVQKSIGYTLPIIMDSPRGKEIDKLNVAKMFDILNRDFSKNQIIVASIYPCGLDDVQEIKLQNRLIE